MLSSYGDILIQPGGHLFLPSYHTYYYFVFYFCSSMLVWYLRLSEPGIANEKKEEISRGGLGTCPKPRKILKVETKICAI